MVRRVPMGIDPQEAADYAELGIGIVTGFEAADPRGHVGDVIVMWPRHGLGWEFPERLEVVNETR
jgi:hypothetical protein